MKRSMALGAAVLALGAGAAGLVQKAAAGGAAATRQTQGGLSVSPAVIEVQNAHTGALATMTVANRSTAPLTVTVTPRPWLQAVTGKVSPNRGKTLPGVTVSEGSFTLNPGAEKQVTANLNALPAAGALYGAMEIVGLPTDVAKRKGLVLGYRVVGAIRLLPAAPKASITAGTIKASKGTAVLPVKNTGNTVNIPLGTKLIKGAATAKITLNQRGKRALQVTKKFTVK